jgi:hypothetical protein
VEEFVGSGVGKSGSVEVSDAMFLIFPVLSGVSGGSISSRRLFFWGGVKANELF